MKTIVSYQKTWDKDGTCYTQTIRVKMSPDELSDLNDTLSDIANELNAGGDVYAGLSVTQPQNLKKSLFFGDNYLTVSQFVVLSKLYDWDLEKRILEGRNTILRIERGKKHNFWYDFCPYRIEH